MTTTAPLGLTADTDLDLLEALTDMPLGVDDCPACITGHLFRPDDIFGDHATSRPERVCESCAHVVPDEDPEY